MAILETGPLRHVILDRDGVLNREPAGGGYVREPGDFHWLPGCLQALARLRAAGVRVSVATNQSGVGRGLVSQRDLDRVHVRMTEEAAAAGGSIDAIFCCTHGPDDGCDCRKPSPGLVTAAIQASGIPPAETVLVGDDHRDLAAGRGAGIAVVLVRTGKGASTERTMEGPRPMVFDDLASLAVEATRSVP
jgi:D-glycero-D-manno-heptose 1,7-bisphosphate phosphatase